MSTSVFMLIDRSSSMAGAPIRLAVTAAASFGIVAENNGVDVAAAMFSDHVAPVGNLGERWSKQCMRIPITTGGGTWMAAAIYYGVSMLSRHVTAERRILLLVTDGHPRNVEEVWEALRECRRYGIEVGAVLLSPDVYGLFTFKGRVPFATADSEGQIPSAIFSVMSAMLR